MENELEADFLPILSAVYDPLLNHCRQMYRAPEEWGGGGSGSAADSVGAGEDGSGSGNSSALSEEQARADAADAARLRCEVELQSTRSALADTNSRLNSVEAAARAAEARFASAVTAIRESVDAQLAVQAERLALWEALVSSAGRPEAKLMHAQAATSLIRGRRQLGELGALLEAERALVAQQGRLFAGAVAS